MSSTSVHSTATMRYWMKRTTSATFSIDRKEVQVALLQIHGGDGTYLSVLLGSLIEVSSVHFCLICSVRFSRFSFFSRTPQRMGNRNGFSVLICPSRCTSPRSSQFLVANHDILDLVGSDREFLRNFFLRHLLRALWATKCSFCASVLLCRAPRGRLFFQSPLVTMLAGFAFFQEMSTSATDDSLTPIKKAF